MTEHPINPPPELVAQWDEECESGNKPEINNTFNALQQFASKAARWGADIELEACCEWLLKAGHSFTSCDLRSVRRPKQPSLKEQALKSLDAMADCMSASFVPMRRDLDTIRCALEQLDD